MSGFKDRKSKNIWAVKNPYLYDNRILLIDESSHGWNDVPKWSNKEGEIVGAPSAPWDVFIQDLLSENIKPQVEHVNKPTDREEPHIAEWRANLMHSLYQVWLLGWDIQSEPYSIEEKLANEKVENKILALECAFELSKRVGAGFYIKRFSIFVKKLIDDIKNDDKNPKILAGILEVYSDDWKAINDL